MTIKSQHKAVSVIDFRDFSTATFIGVCPVRALCATYAADANLATAFYCDDGEAFAKLAAKVQFGKLSIGLGDFAVNVGTEGVIAAREAVKAAIEAVRTPKAA